MSQSAALQPPHNPEGRDDPPGILRFPSVRKSLIASPSPNLSTETGSHVSSTKAFRFLTSDEPPNTFRSSSSSDITEPINRRSQLLATIDEFLPQNKLDPRNASFRHSDPFLSPADLEASNAMDTITLNSRDVTTKLCGADEYGMEVSLHPVKPAGYLERFFSRPFRKPKLGMEDNQGWTYGKAIFIGGIILTVIGVTGFFAFMMAEDS